MDTDRGMSSVSGELPKLATVQRLHIGEPGEGRGEDEWYETERLTGHLTGGARPSTQAVAEDDAQRLDWRAGPAPDGATPLEGLRARIGARLRRRHLAVGERQSDAAPAARQSTTCIAPATASGDQARQPVTSVADGRSDGERLAMRGDRTDGAGERSVRYGRQHRRVVLLAGVVAVVAVLSAGIGVLALGGPLKPRTPALSALSAGHAMAAQTPAAATGHGGRKVRVTHHTGRARGAGTHSASKRRNAPGRRDRRTAARRSKAVTGKTTTGQTTQGSASAQRAVSNADPRERTGAATGSTTTTTAATTTAAAAVSATVLPPAPDQNASAPPP